MVVTVIDADRLIMGRLSSLVAKRLLDGEEIVIINAEKCLITGNSKEIYQRYFDARARGKIRKGPHFPRMPDRILKRTVRGMLPYQKPRGREALKRLKVYIGTPRDYRDAEAIKLEQAATLNTTKYIPLSEVSMRLGARLQEVDK